MVIEFAYTVTLGLIFVLLLIFLLYSDYRRKCASFPFSHLVPYLIYCQVTGIISKKGSLNNAFLQKIMELGKKHMKDGLYMTFLTRPILIIFNEDALKVFSNNKLTLDNAPEYKLADEVLGAGLVSSNGERWRSHRKLLEPAFHMGMLKEKVPLFNEHAMALIKDMEQFAGKTTTYILKSLKIHYLNSLLESVFGLKENEENRAKIRRGIELADSLSPELAQRIFCPWLRPKYLLMLSSFGRKHLRDLKEGNEIITSFITEMKKLVSSNEIADSGYFGEHLRKSISYLLLNRHLNDPTFTFQDIHEETKTMMATGYDTVTYTTMWCLYLLGLHPEVQEKVYNEIQTIANDYVSYEESAKLQYLECVLMETLRIYPTIPFFGRNLSEDVEFGKYKVFKGTTIFYAPVLSHKDPKVFPDPEVFIPERFFNKEIRRSPNFIPFAEGNRPCLGKYYGLIKMKIFLAHILRNYKVQSLDRREDISLSYAIVMSPEKPLRMRITSRHNETL